LPQNQAEQQVVSESLVRLVSFYLKLAEAPLGAHRPGGSMFASGFRVMAGPPLDA
jgi:hypothetical protein